MEKIPYPEKQNNPKMGSKL